MGKNNGSSSSSTWTSSWLNNAVKKAFTRSPLLKDVGKRSCGGSRRRQENEHEDNGGEEEEEEKKRGKRRWLFSKPLPPLETRTIIIHHHNVAKVVANSPGPVVIDNKNEVVVVVDVVRKELKMDDSSDFDHNSTTIADTAQAAMGIIRLTSPSLVGKQQEAAAAVFIQSFFRGYLARRALQALKGAVKLQALIRGHNVRKRAKMTLQCIQSLVRVQAQVCDQRRRLSCESTTLGSMFNQASSGRKSININVGKVSNHSSTRDEILDLIERAKECSLRQGKTLVHALSQQIRNLDEERFSDTNYEELEKTHRCSENTSDRNLCNPRVTIKTVEMDNNRPHSYAISSPVVKKHRDISVQSPKTPSSSKIKSINQVHSSSPSYKTEERDYDSAHETPNLRANYYHRMSTSENTCYVPRPNYMAATASAMARVRSVSVPRQRPSSPIREPNSAKKRLYFPVIN